MAKKHYIITEIGEYFRIVPDQNYVLRNKKSQRLYSDVITKEVNDYEAVAK